MNKQTPLRRGFFRQSEHFANVPSWPNGLASEKRTVELSPHCPLFELNGADIANGSMASFSVIEALDVIEHICTRFIPGLILSSIDALTFE